MTLRLFLVVVACAAGFVLATRWQLPVAQAAHHARNKDDIQAHFHDPATLDLLLASAPAKLPAAVVELRDTISTLERRAAGGVSSGS